MEKITVKCKCGQECDLYVNMQMNQTKLNCCSKCGEFNQYEFNFLGEGDIKDYPSLKWNKIEGE